MSVSQGVMVAAVAIPAIAGAAVAAAGAGRADRSIPAALWGTIVAWACAVALLVLVAVGGPVALVSETESGRATAGLVADQFSAVLLVLVTGVLAVVQGFALRYLSGDPRAQRFFALSSMTAAATGAAVCAATLTGLVLAWCLASVGLCLMLAHRRDLPQARAGARRAAAVLALGDGALVLAAILVVLTGPDLDLRRLDPAELSARGVALPVAALVALAALARSAQVPLHRWLPATLNAPTPVSALLHAGLVNGAGILLIRLAPIVGAAPVVLWAVLAAGLASAVVATGFMLVRPDVKSGLAWSTGGQMGFMVAQCATGAFAGALFHLILHGAYKATLFLGSGSAVDARSRHLRAPVPRALLAPGSRAAVAALLPALMIGGAIVVIAPHLAGHTGAPLLLAFAWASAAHATWGWLSAGGRAGRAALIAAGLVLAAGCWGYVGAVALFDAFVGPALPVPPASAPPAWVVLAVIGAAALAAGLMRTTRTRVPAVGTLERRFYALLWSSSTPEPVRRSLRPRRALRAEPAGRREPELSGAPA